MLAEFRDALRYIRKRAVLIVSVLGALFSSLLGVSMIQLAEPFARQVLHEGAGKYGLLVAAYGVGAITGSVITVARGDVYRRSTLTVVGFAIFVVAELTFGLAPVYAVALLGMYGIGLAQSFAMVACQTAVQVNVDEHYRGRVLSVYVMSFFAGTPIGTLVGGIMASFIGLRATIVASAVLLAIVVIVTMLRYPWFRVLDESRMGFDAHVEDDGHLVIEPLEYAALVAGERGHGVEDADHLARVVRVGGPVAVAHVAPRRRPALGEVGVERGGTDRQTYGESGLWRFAAREPESA